MSRPVDEDPNTNVLIATVKDSIARVAGHQVVYVDAFDGVRADVRLTYSAAGVMQEVLLREQMPGPDAWGLNPASARLTAITEVVEGPPPQVTERVWQAGGQTQRDQTLDFGTMRMVQGRGFDVRGGNPRSLSWVPVTKEYGTVQGRRILLEQLRYAAIQDELLRLPAPGTTTNSPAGASLKKPTRWLALLPPAPPAPKTPAAPVRQLAALNPPDGFVLDWNLVESGLHDFVFDCAASTTYLVRGELHLAGQTLFFAGAVLKYCPGSSIYLDGPLSFVDSNPACGSAKAVLTSVDDRSVGELLPSRRAVWEGEFGPALVVGLAEYANALQQIEAHYARPGIIPNDPTPFPTVTVAATVPQARKGGQPGAFTISRSPGDWSQPLTVRYHLAGTAQASVDFQSLDGVATIPANQKSVVVPVQPAAPGADPRPSNISLGLQPDATYLPAAPQTATVSILGANGPVQSVPAPSGIVAWWPGENNATDIVGGNNGSLFNGASYAPGEVGQAFTVDGTTAYIQAPAPSLANALTLELWVSVGAYPNNDAVLIAGKDSTSAHEYQVALCNTPGYWNFRSLILQPGGVWTYFYGNTTVQPNTWYHLAMTYDGTTLVQYVNGVLDGSVAAGGGIATTSCSMLIGGYGTGPWTLNGQVDELSLYNRALSQGEIQAIYNAGPAGKCLTCATPPTITTQPQSQTVAPGANVTFSVVATGTAPLSYQWTFNGINLSGANASSLSLNNVQAANAGNYAVVVSNSGGSVTSANAVLTVTGGGGGGGSTVAWIDDPPLPAGAVPMTYADTWSWIQSGPAPYSGAWSHKSDTVSGMHQHYFENATATLTICDGDVLFGYVYLYPGTLPQEVMLQWEATDSTWWFHRAYWGADVIQWPPYNQAYMGPLPAAGGWVRLEVPASAVDLVGRTIEGMAFTLWDGNAAWDYAGKVGCSSSSIPPTITAQPQSQTVAQGANVSFSVTATGSAPLTYQWYKNTDSNPVGANSPTLNLNNVQSSDAGSYYVKVSNSAGTVTSQSATLTVTGTAQPIITTPPANLVVDPGSDATFAVAATGASPLSYQWTSNGNNLVDGDQISGATCSELIVHSAQPANAGTYCVILANSFGSASACATLALNGPNLPAVSLCGAQPCFTASPATLVASVSVVSPATLSSLTLNGVAQTLQTGQFSLSPALSAQGANTFTLVATDSQGRSGQASTTVYFDSQAPTVTITDPANNASFSTTRINVRGTFTEDNLKRIIVNGELAFISGNSFEAFNVPLVAGANTITATAEDLAGNTGSATITVNGSGTMNDPVQLSATPVGGFAALTVTFTPTVNVPGTIQQVLYDFSGDNTTFQTYTDTNPKTYTYNTAGEYFPVVIVQTTAGRFASPGGWNAGPWDARLRINVQIPPVQVNVINVPDPVDLKCTPDGHLYVLSRSTATLTEYDSTGSQVRSLGGGALGSTPTGLDVDGAGNVYVVLSGDNQVAKFKPNANSFQLDTTFQGGRIGVYGTGNGQFIAPWDVAVTPDGTRIAVSDSGNNRIQVFSSAGAFLQSFGQQGSGSQQFNSPKGLTCDAFGILYIVDSGNNRIVVSDSAAFLGTSGSAGTDLGQFTGPINLSVGSRGIYVADSGNNRVQVFDPLASGQSPPFSPRLALPGQLSPALAGPYAVAAISDLMQEKLYIADTGNNRVLLVQLPLDDPTAVWSAMTGRLAAGDIPGAIPYVASLAADDYRETYLTIGAADLSPVMAALPAISPIYLEREKAQYYFQQTVDNALITFPIDFVKENGVWKIMEY